jgi:lincosamide nucleotidyltransferase A/C/D/E
VTWQRLTRERLRGQAARLGESARGRAVPAARAAYTALERSPLAFLLRAPAVQHLKARITHMPDSRVLTLLDAIAAAGPPCWVAGGWGIDALLGRQTRRHYDLDLVMSDTPDDVDRMGRVLARAGFRPVVTESNPGLFMPVRHCWQDDQGCTVEVMPVPLHEPPSSATARAAPRLPWDQQFTRGTIGGREVPCLSASLQFTLHEGYAARGIDRADVAALRAQVSREEGVPPA